MSLLVATGLSKAFGALDVFSGVDLRIEAGDRIGMVGANGAGKTTLLRILAGVEAPTAGDVFAQARADRSAICRRIRRRPATRRCTTRCCTSSTICAPRAPR